ncbi:MULTISPECIES: hypothetical protein [Rhodopseudomonas]|nr:MULTISPECIES: hypothetical protein [Rhodopseudomonas]
MDKRITFRFYRVRPANRTRLDFGEVLTQIGNIPRPCDRERQLATDYHVRAEIVERAQGSIHGELTRIQRTNFPSEVQDDGRRSLRVRNPLGHGVVFRYLPGTEQIGLQYDPRVLSPSKFSYYVGQIIDGAHFEFEPIVRDDMWDRFNQGTVRKVSISISRPDNLGVLERGGAASVTRSMRDMADAYAAPSITIELSMGHRRGGLANAVRSMVRHFRTQAVQDQIEISSMKAKVKPEGEKTEDLDLLEDFLSTKEVLQLQDNNPEENYRIKLAALREKMRERL